MQLALKFVCLGLNLSIWPFKLLVLLLWFLAPVLKALGNTACRATDWNVWKGLNACTKTLLELLELWMDAKVLPCGLACRKEGPQINSKTLGKEQSQLSEILQDLSFRQDWFSPWLDSGSITDNIESWICPFQQIIISHYWSCYLFCWFVRGQTLLNCAHFSGYSISSNTELPFLFYFYTFENTFVVQ